MTQTAARKLPRAAARPADDDSNERGLLASPAFWIGGALSALMWVAVAVAIYGS